MSDSLQKTFDLLAATDNEAAVAALLEALDLPNRDVRDRAFRTLLARRSERAEDEILRRWGKLSERWKTLISQRVGWISGAVRKAVLGTDGELCRAGCDAAVWTHDYDLIPVLVRAAEDKSNAHLEHALAAVLQLSEKLSEELAAPRDERLRRDPELQRQHVLPSLERAAESFESHGRRELVESFLLLADNVNETLNRILQAPGNRNFVALLEVMANSSRPGVERLLLSFLTDSQAPLSAIHVMARRRDISFLRHLLRKIGAEPSPIVRMNLKRIETIPWMQTNLALLDALGETEQPGAVQLAALSGINRQLAFDAVAYVLRHGTLAGRRAAARAMAEFRGAGANDLAMRALEDEDPLVRAAIATQLRERGVPGAINRLIQLLDSVHQVEREAAQMSLDEFKFDKFLNNFDNLSEEARRTTGSLVKRIDPQCLNQVKAELESGTRTRRKRALELVHALDAVGELHASVAALLKDEDQYLRIEAIHVLGASDSQRTRASLREALLDPHPLVQEAAESALAQLARTTAKEPAKPRTNDTVRSSTVGVPKMGDPPAVPAGAAELS